VYEMCYINKPVLVFLKMLSFRSDKCRETGSGVARDEEEMYGWFHVSTTCSGPIRYDYTHFTHTYKEASPEGSWGLLNIQLGNVISWSETPDIHIVQFSVCV